MTDEQENAKQLIQKLKRYFLEREIGNFYIYLNTLEQPLNAKQQEISTSIAHANEDLVRSSHNDPYRAEVIDLTVDAEQLKGFSNLLRQSFLISLYSFMELWLIRECYIDGKHRDGGKSYGAIKEKGIRKAKKYFSDVMQTNFPFETSQDWLWITNFKLFRGCIVHRQGSLTGFSDFKADPNLENFVQKESGLNLHGVDNNQVFVEYEFCLKALKTVHRFMLQILSLQTGMS